MLKQLLPATDKTDLGLSEKTKRATKPKLQTAAQHYPWRAGYLSAPLLNPAYTSLCSGVFQCQHHLEHCHQGKSRLHTKNICIWFALPAALHITTTITNRSIWLHALPFYYFTVLHCQSLWQQNLQSHGLLQKPYNTNPPDSEIPPTSGHCGLSRYCFCSRLILYSI